MPGLAAAERRQVADLLRRAVAEVEVCKRLGAWVSNRLPENVASKK